MKCPHCHKSIPDDTVELGRNGLKAMDAEKDRMTNEQQEEILRLSRECEQARMRVQQLGMQAIPHDWEARIVAQQDYDLAETEYFRARTRLEAAKHRIASAAGGASSGYPG